MEVKWKFIKRGNGIYVQKNGIPHVVIREGYNAVSALLDEVQELKKENKALKSHYDSNDIAKAVEKLRTSRPVE
jgi:hypothetical protein